jgi:Flp pilus assembly pilin Flp
MNQRFLTKKSEKGQGLVEYTLIVVLIVIPVIGALTLFGPEIKVMVTDLMYALSGGYTVQNGVLIHGPTSTTDPSAPSATYIPTYTSAPAVTLIPTFTSGPPITLTRTATTTLTATLTQTATTTLTATSTQTATTTQTTTSTPTTTLTPTATPIGIWITCANENGFCSFSGTAQVQYGANGVWVTQIHTNGVACTNAVFGDPIPGVVKTCEYYQVAAATPTPTSTSVPQWIDCATQNGYCSFTGTYAVRFGRGSTWVTQIHTDGVACTTTIFGNPTWGTKKCQVYK